MECSLIFLQIPKNCSPPTVLALLIAMSQEGTLHFTANTAYLFKLDKFVAGQMGGTNA